MSILNIRTLILPDLKGPLPKEVPTFSIYN